MKKILALIVCLSSFSVFAGNIESEWDATSLILVQKPFNKEKFVKSIKSSTYLKNNIDYRTHKNNPLLMIAIDANIVPAATILVEDFRSNLRQLAGGPGTAPITSRALYMGSFETYAYLCGLQSDAENEKRKKSDEAAVQEAAEEQESMDDYIDHLKRVDDLLMKKNKSRTKSDVFKILRAVLGAAVGSVL